MLFALALSQKRPWPSSQLSSLSHAVNLRGICNVCNTIVLKYIFFLFLVVEQVDNSASLYASSIQGHHLCVLVKQLPVKLFYRVMQSRNRFWGRNAIFLIHQ